MKKRGVLIFAALLVIITGVVAWWHLSTRENVASGTLQVTAGGQKRIVELASLQYEPVSGVRLNGKGESIPVEGQGILLKNLLTEEQASSCSKVRVIADDAYSAELTPEELQEDGKAYLLLQDDELRLVVFGDENSKRSINHVVQIVVE